MTDEIKVQKPFWKRWWFIGLVILLLIGGLARMGKNSRPAVSERPTTTSTASTPTATPTDAGTASEPTREATDGLGVGRSKFTPVLEHDDVGFTFHEGAAVDGLPNWVGSSRVVKGGVVQMVGDPDNLHKVSAVAIARSGEQENALSVLMVVTVANITDPEIGAWVKKQIKEHDFQKSFSESKRFDRAKVKLRYDYGEQFAVDIEAR